MTAPTTFDALGLSDKMQKIIRDRGFTTPSSIQALTIPFLLENNDDLIGQAQTGTGKTGAFGIPILERIQPGKRHVQALILTPTRELAKQVCDELIAFKGISPVNVISVYGGQAMDKQLRALRHGADIVVGTPGRVIDHLERRTLDLSQLAFFVLDEADEMLNMGFLEDIEHIFQKSGPDKRTLLFSATMPDEIFRIAKKFMKKYTLLATNQGQSHAPKIVHTFAEVRHHTDKLDGLCRILDTEPGFYGVVFCRTKADVSTIAQKLADKGYLADGLHGDLSQNQREKILGKFKSHHHKILVATDVAARGLDIQDLTHVINFSLPQDNQTYVHRIGRTGRAGKTGKAITIITSREFGVLQRMKKATKIDIQKQHLPQPQDVARIKKENLKSTLLAQLDKPQRKSSLDLAKELMDTHDPQIVIAALLQHGFKNELN